MLESGPVPGRECGACDACCVLFEITEPAIAKPAGVPCRHLTRQGCAIYENRPQMCRAWLCGWRLIPGLPENWRPDLSGILIYQMRCQEPGYGPDAFIMGLSRGLGHLSDLAVLGFVQNLLERRVPLYLTLHAGKIESRARFLNEILEPSVAARDANAFFAVLRKAIEEQLR
jgi:hypothetical protein